LLADGLRERGAEAVVEDGLTAMGPLVQAAVRRGAETILRRLRLLFRLQYWLSAKFPPTRLLVQVLGVRLGGEALLDLVRRHRADAVVSTYPGTSDVIGRLRASGRLAVPAASAITDLAALRYWAHPGLDLHLLTHAESAEEVAGIIGRRSGIRHVRG